MKGILYLLAILNCTLFCSGYYDNYYSYSISDGTCRGRRAVGEDVVLDGETNMIKQRILSWLGHGQYRITCIRARNNLSQRADAGTARIIEGVEVWVEDMSPSRITATTTSPYRQIYIGGQRYCSC
ncbi:hypothetical protein GWI33_010679 [Rhynchophorus ferrugineus]|uniref:Uncharacterized protein n=1 Tax=Rhynchophorus ferrugineus TaxID=354439 RepID=A0A834IX01_RHYFE|nr:hypothetical protein GWI33_010679 [Rhynchophorus ferrugineus]